MSLLPPNSTALERGFERQIAGRFDAIPIPIRDLRRHATCPEPLLAWLAWDESVDVWEDDWPEETKRAVIAASFNVHLHKGTVGAVRRALEALKIGLEIQEWFESGDPRGTFRVNAYAEKIFDAGLGINPALIAIIRAQVDSVKRGTAHYSLRLGERFATKQPIRFGVRAKKRQSLNLTPRPEDDEESAGVLIRSGLAHRFIHNASFAFPASTI